MKRKSILILATALAVAMLAGGAWYLSGQQTDQAAASTQVSGLLPDKVQQDDKVMGNPKAPVTVIEYFAQACSACAHFDQAVFPLLKAKYIDTGKVRYVMRLFPLFPIDGPAYKLDLCVPREQFFQSVDLLFRTQPQWDSAEYPGADAPGGLLRAAHMMGLSDERAQACMSSTAQDAAINRVAQEGLDRYAIGHTPTFVIGFQKVEFPNLGWDEVQSAIDRALNRKAG